MATETLELARAVMDALSTRDAERLVELADPEVEWYSLFALGPGVYRGHPGTRQYMRDLDEAWEVGRAEIDDSIMIGAVVVMVGRIHYRGKGSGVEDETPVGWMLKFRDERVLRFQAFREPERALEALGRA
jgi:ketosteroid isomerase-like protein